MKIFESNNQLSFSVGDKESELVPIDMKIGMKNITDSDNFAYIAQIRQSISFDIENISKKNSFTKYNKYFEGLSFVEILEFILSTRDLESENYNIENDDIYPYHRIMDWGPTCDHLTTFLIPDLEGKLKLLCLLYSENADEYEELIVTQTTSKQIKETFNSLLSEIPEPKRGQTPLKDK